MSAQPVVQPHRRLRKRIRMSKETCEKLNCVLEKAHDGHHTKKVAHGKVVIHWLDGKWWMPDGQEGTYTYAS